MIARPVVGRFAPSPTGPLHLGSLVAAVGSWLFARRAGGPLAGADRGHRRASRGARVGGGDPCRAASDTGCDWDGEPVWQSARTPLYEDARRQAARCGVGLRLRLLARRAAAAGIGAHARENAEPVYPGTCRDGIAPGRSAAFGALSRAAGSQVIASTTPCPASRRRTSRTRWATSWCVAPTGRSPTSSPSSSTTPRRA